MAKIPVDELAITHAYGPHLSASIRGTTSDEPERLVKTHCCFCGQQCGVKLLVKDEKVVGVEPWEEFPFNRGKLCPKGVKRYMQNEHPDRLLTARISLPASQYRDIASTSAFFGGLERYFAYRQCDFLHRRLGEAVGYRYVSHNRFQGWGRFRSISQRLGWFGGKRSRGESQGGLCNLGNHGLGNLGLYHIQ